MRACSWFLSAGLVLSVADGADACKCGPEPTPTEALATASTVFEGVVADRWLQARWLDPYGHGAFAVPLVHYRFRVARVWKGRVVPDFVVTQGGGCSPLFFVGRRYVMYVQPDEVTGGHVSPGCGPSTPFPDAVAHVRALGPPTTTYPRNTGDIRPQQPFGRWLQAVTVAGVVVHANHLRHPTEEFRSASVAPGVSVVAMLLAAAIWTCWRRQRRLAAVLLMVACLTTWGALVHAGAGLARDPWFAYVTNW